MTFEEYLNQQSDAYAAGSYSTGEYAPEEVWAEPVAQSYDYAAANYSTGEYAPADTWAEPMTPYQETRRERQENKQWTYPPSDQWARENYTVPPPPHVATTELEYQDYLPVPGPHNNWLYKPDVDRTYETDSPWDSGDAYSTGQYAPDYFNPQTADLSLDPSSSFRDALSGTTGPPDPAWDVWSDPIVTRAGETKPNGGQASRDLRYSNRLEGRGTYLRPTHGRYHDDYYVNLAWDSLAANPYRADGLPMPEATVPNTGISQQGEYRPAWGDRPRTMDGDWPEWHRETGAGAPRGLLDDQSPQRVR